MALKNIPFFKKLKGFTLTEILVAVLILGIVGGSVLMLGHTYIKHFEQANEITVAKDRATMVLTYLEKRVLHTGQGMNVSADEFEAAFDGLWEHQDFKSFKDIKDRRWQRPIQKPKPPGSLEPYSESEELLVAYAVPTGTYTTGSKQVVPSTGEEVDISDEPAHIEGGDAKVTKGWVVFSTLPVPFFVTKDIPPVSGGKTTITILARPLPQGGSKPWPVRANDELHYVRFMEARVEDGLFKVRDLAISNIKSGLQPIVEGILDCRFRLDKNGLLAVSILARGNKKYSRFISPVEVPHWGTVKDNEWRKYQLVALTRGWRVRNWRPE